MPTWSSYNYGFCNPIVFNDPSGNNPDNNGAKISEQGQAKLVEMAKATSQYSDAIKRGDKVILEQYFNVSDPENGGVAQSQQELNVGIDGAKAFYISQSGIVNADGQPSYPGGNFEMSFGSDAKFPAPEVKQEQPIEEAQASQLSEPTPTTEPKENIPIKEETKTTPIKLQVQSMQKKHPHPTPVLLTAPPQMRITSANEVTGGAIWRADLSQQGFKYMLGLVKELRNTNLGSIDITFGIPSNMNRGIAIHSGGGREEAVDPKTMRVTTQNPMIKRSLVGTGNMDVRNIEAQGRELQSELSRRLHVPVQLRFNYNSNSGVLFRFIPKRR